MAAFLEVFWGFVASKALLSAFLFAVPFPCRLLLAQRGPGEARGQLKLVQGTLVRLPKCTKTIVFPYGFGTFLFFLLVACFFSSRRQLSLSLFPPQPFWLLFLRPLGLAHQCVTFARTFFDTFLGLFLSKNTPKKGPDLGGPR